ncbi:MAG: YggS family pyridoxal phosphate-dependent enzyme [Treponema sp.]|nr:YggS family pyridoxal phosphate-dependent enzyme [Treponema sp.]
MIKENLKVINEKIKKAEVKAGRKPDSVRLMAVSKFHPAEDVIQALQAGQTLFGENRVQEAREKFPAIVKDFPAAELHIIGNLQSNKVKHAVEIASCIQSVDRIELLPLIEKSCVNFEKKIKVLFEIHTAEDSKSGFEGEEDIRKVMDDFRKNLFPHVIPCGFMTMAPFTDDEEAVRSSFRKAVSIAERIKSDYHEFNLNELSMGMSNDFEIAIEEGSTLVRIGTAIFGERDYSKK